ncbi:MAG: archease, partial [Acidobacteria bacterium]|nr:archease [Acidobacteriota bacterium]
LDLQATGANYEDLLVGWLSEILCYLDTEGWVFCDFAIRRLEAGLAEGEGIGERRDPAQRARAVPVKAVTYHLFSVRHTGGGCCLF